MKIPKLTHLTFQDILGRFLFKIQQRLKQNAEAFGLGALTSLKI